VGEMEKPLATGKAAKPRCFKNLKINNLPASWRNNKKKSWMTPATMKEWLNMFNAKMKKENGNVIHFLDNATFHPKEILSNVNITCMQQVYNNPWIWVLFTHSNCTTGNF
jgi:hypothetical protein